MDCIINKFQNGISEDSLIIPIHIHWHMIAFGVPWMIFQGQSNNFVVDCSVVVTDRQQTGTKLHCKHIGPPMVFSKFTFNESIYTDVIQHLFCLDINEGTNQPHDMKWSFRDNIDRHLRPLTESGKIYAKKGSTNVFAYGTGDKYQVTEIPQVSYEGDVILFHTTLKGTTSSCLPKSQFQA